MSGWVQKMEFPTAWYARINLFHLDQKLVINCKAGEIIRLVVSIRLSFWVLPKRKHYQSMCLSVISSATSVPRFSS